MAIKKKLLIQLPKSNPYFPFSTNFKVLNFVRNDLRKDIIQYHKKLNKQGHMTIGKSMLQGKLIEIIERPVTDGFMTVPEIMEVPEIRQSTIYYAGLLGRWDKRIIEQESDVPSIIFDRKILVLDLWREVRYQNGEVRYQNFA
jgi:hypothetical protein